MPLQLTHKQLKELAKKLNAHYFNSNIYDYENKLHYLNSIVHYTDDTLKQTEKEEMRFRILLNQIHDLVVTKNVKYVRTIQLAYSKGIYGNTGQLHQIQYFNIYSDIIKTIYTYV